MLVGLGPVQRFPGVKKSDYSLLLLCLWCAGAVICYELTSWHRRMLCYISNAFNGSTIEQQQDVCTNVKCPESPEKVDTLLGPGAHSFNINTPAEFAVNVNTQVLV